jgi:hypothetical protein
MARFSPLFPHSRAQPYGGEGRGVEVKEADDYEDELEAKMARMLNRNQHTKQQDASAKAKGSCAQCHKTITEDEHWVDALGKTFHKVRNGALCVLF